MKDDDIEFIKTRKKTLQGVIDGLTKDELKQNLLIQSMIRDGVSIELEESLFKKEYLRVLDEALFYIKFRLEKLGE